MKKVSFIVSLLSSLLMVISGLSVIVGKHTSFANQLFMISAIGFGVGRVMCEMSKVLQGTRVEQE